MLQQDSPDDYVLATGETHSVREFVELAAEVIGFNLAWEGVGQEERGIDRHTGKVVVRVNPEFYRPAEVDLLLGNPEKARSRLGWSPRVGFSALVRMMAERDMERAAKGVLRY